MRYSPWLKELDMTECARVRAHTHTHTHTHTQRVSDLEGDVFSFTLRNFKGFLLFLF